MRQHLLLPYCYGDISHTLFRMLQATSPTMPQACTALWCMCVPTKGTPCASAR